MRSEQWEHMDLEVLLVLIKSGETGSRTDPAE